MLSPEMQRLHDAELACARPVSRKVRELSAEYFRRDNERHGREIWTDREIGEVLNGKRDHAPVCQAIADALEILGVVE